MAQPADQPAAVRALERAPAVIKLGEAVTVTLTVVTPGSCWAPGASGARLDDATRTISFAPALRYIGGLGRACGYLEGTALLSEQLVPKALGTYRIRAEGGAGELAVEVLSP